LVRLVEADPMRASTVFEIVLGEDIGGDRPSGRGRPENRQDRHSSRDRRDRDNRRRDDRRGKRLEGGPNKKKKRK
jgi:hypothetical protein